MSDSSEHSDTDAPGPRNRGAQDETPIMETPARPASNTFDDRRLVSLSQRYAQQTRTILNTPGGAGAIASRIAQAFQPNRQIAPRPQRRNTRGRPTNVFQVRFLAVRDPTTNRGQGFNMQDLAAYGLGNPPADTLNRHGNNELLLSWDAEQLRQYIESLFPTLFHVDFQLLYNPNRPGLVVIDATTPLEIKTFYQGVRSSRSNNGPRLIIRPTQPLTHTHMDTPTVHMRESMDTTNQADASSVSTAVTEPARSVSETAANLANLATEPIEVTRQIREEQDAAYNRSLRADQERDRLRAISQQREELRRRLDQDRSEELRRLRESMRQSIPEQPDVGITVRLRFPEGGTATRRFDPAMTVEALINLAGSNDNSTRRFRLHLPWSRQVIYSNDHENFTLAEIGIRQSSAVDVQWIDEQADDVSPKCHTPASSPQRVMSSSPASSPETLPSLSPSTSFSGSNPTTPTTASAASASPPLLSSRPVPSTSSPATTVSNVSTPAPPVSSAATSTYVSSSTPVTSAAPLPALGESSVNLNLQIDDSIQVRRFIQIRRSSVVDDVLAAMASDDVLETDLRVCYVDEQAVDERGVFRDVLSAFWEGAIDRFFEGEGSVIPSLTEAATQQTWRSIGRVLTVGWRQVGFLPIRVNMCSLAAAFLEGDHEVTVSSWADTFGGAEREALLHPRADDPMILDIISRYRARNTPSASSLQDQLTRCAYVNMVQRPFFAYSAMGVRGTFQTFRELEEAYTRLIPNGGVVAEMLRCTPSSQDQQTTLDFLVRAIRNMDQDTLQLFLRFTSGSSALVVPYISVNFVPLSGLGRRVVAHTCSVTLDLPIYHSYREFRQELYAVLRSGQWEMDFV